MSSLEIRTSRFGLLNSESNWADEVANVCLLLVQVLVEQEFACLPRGATYYASSSFRSNDSETSYTHGRVTALGTVPARGFISGESRVRAGDCSSALYADTKSTARAVVDC